MKEKFFSDYKKYIVIPVNETLVSREEYAPENYAAHYILTLSIFNPKITTWKDAKKYDIDIEKSIKTVLDHFNDNYYDKYHLELLELDKFTNYFILALSTKLKFDPQEEEGKITSIIEKKITNSFYVGQNWFNLIGEKGRVERKLFCCSYKEYVLEKVGQ